MFSLNGGETFVDSRHRQLEAALQAAREIFGLARHLVRLALRGGRDADHQAGGLPFRHQLLDLDEIRHRRERMRSAQLGFPYCNAYTLETEVEGEDGAARHVPHRPAASCSRGREAPSPPAAAPRPASRR